MVKYGLAEKKQWRSFRISQSLSLKEQTNEALDFIIGEYLDDLKNNYLIHDDTSLALVVTSKAKDFQHGKKQKGEWQRLTELRV